MARHTKISHNHKRSTYRSIWLPMVDPTHLGFEGRCCRESFRCGIVEERPGTHDIGGARARAGGSWIDPGAGSARVLSLLPRLPRDRQVLDASIRINSSDRSWLPLSPFGRKLAGEFLKSDVFVHA